MTQTNIGGALEAQLSQDRVEAMTAMRNALTQAAQQIAAYDELKRKADACDKFEAALLEISQVACSNSPEQRIANAALSDASVTVTLPRALVEGLRDELRAEKLITDSLPGLPPPQYSTIETIAGEQFSYSGFTGKQMVSYAKAAISAFAGFAAPVAPVTEREKKEAARYRWLRDIGDSTYTALANHPGYSADLCDNEIDKAIERRMSPLPSTNAGEIKP